MGDAKEAKLRHPAGLYILFFVEMWERFGIYCMEAVFVYYMRSSQYEVPSLSFDIPLCSSSSPCRFQELVTQGFSR